MAWKMTNKRRAERKRSFIYVDQPNNKIIYSAGGSEQSADIFCCFRSTYPRVPEFRVCCKTQLCSALFNGSPRSPCEHVEAVRYRAASTSSRDQTSDIGKLATAANLPRSATDGKPGESSLLFFKPIRSDYELAIRPEIPLSSCSAVELLINDLRGTFHRPRTLNPGEKNLCPLT